MYLPTLDIALLLCVLVAVSFSYPRPLSRGLGSANPAA